MFDLWYTTGAAIMSKPVFDEIKTESNSVATAAGLPLFYSVNTIRFFDVSTPATTGPLLNPNTGGGVPLIEDSGFIVELIIEDVRAKVAAALKNGGFTAAPPVSLYTAGKFCQWLTVTHFDIEANLAKARQGYAAQPAAPRSANFPALLGAMLVDRALTDSMTTPLKPEGKAMLAEFKIADAAEISLVQALAKPASDFKKAQEQLLGNPQTWASCGQQVRSWSPRTDAMVI